MLRVYCVFCTTPCDWCAHAAIADKCAHNGVLGTAEEDAKAFLRDTDVVFITCHDHWWASVLRLRFRQCYYFLLQRSHIFCHKGIFPHLLALPVFLSFTAFLCPMHELLCVVNRLIVSIWLQALSWCLRQQCQQLPQSSIDQRWLRRNEVVPARAHLRSRLINLHLIIRLNILWGGYNQFTPSYYHDFTTEQGLLYREHAYTCVVGVMNQSEPQVWVVEWVIFST